MFKEKELGYKEIGLLILIAYAFSFFIRMIWDCRGRMNRVVSCGIMKL